MIKSILETIADVECGLHSGIPPCCIAWYFVKKPFENLSRRSEFFSRIHDKYFLRIERRGGKAFCMMGIPIGYIVCPKCFRNETFIQIKECPYNVHWDGHYYPTTEPPPDMEYITIHVGKRSVPLRTLMPKGWFNKAIKNVSA